MGAHKGFLARLFLHMQLWNSSLTVQLDIKPQEKNYTFFGVTLSNFPSEA
jgi:hypothetical protein